MSDEWRNNCKTPPGRTSTAGTWLAGQGGEMLGIQDCECCHATFGGWKGQPKGKEQNFNGLGEKGSFGGSVEEVALAC